MEPQIHIVGPLRIQNELIASCLERETSFNCVTSQELDLSSIDTQDTSQTHLILWDSMAPNLDSLWTQLPAGFSPNFAYCFVALFNVLPGKGIEIEAAKRGVRGVFHKDAPLKIFVKGTRALLNINFWFSRDTLATFLTEARNRTWISNEIEASIFTPREKEILLLLASGATNPQIAEKLCISPHTVRTHTVNIYQKINVTNRLQAALWALKHL
jgi:DNA-binding NarL/FixJ family response regulator